jgi:hypothetical protein
MTDEIVSRGLISRRKAFGSSVKQRPVDEPAETSDETMSVPTPRPIRIADYRAVELQTSVAERQQIKEVVTQALSGVVSDPVMITKILDGVIEINRNYKGIRDSAIQVGRRLRKLRSEHVGGFEVLFNCPEKIMPFSHSTASKMMKLAEVVDSGILSVERLPLSYSAAYEIANIAEVPGMIADIERAGLLSPDTTRSRVLNWKRQRDMVSADPEKDAKWQMLLSERRSLLKRLLELRRKMNAIRANNI